MSAQDWRTHDTDELPTILAAALECFVEQGYHGTSIREVASRAGLSVPGVYHHYPSKQAILVAIMEHAMADLWWRSEAAAAEAADDPWSQLRAQVECLVLFHSRKQDLAFIAWSEIRSLSPEHRVEHISRRDRQQRVLDRIVEQGVADGVLQSRRPREASRAVTTMCTAVAQWYRTGGPLSPDELALEYVALVAAMLGRPDPG
ncbi:TetR/AcrR family transcriptional regulator [Serinicoccus kebangsaanensis]|uniref:TetR/AcrR family transcriptional regulator n=1 Tax=Serinicoccus kebangsaanensis TaxID=2602069 RepID=UPI00192E2BCE|nr:TetR/AcrR family transcriptional regulator [Serinicoccus kebangsaanensis]